MPNYSRVGFRRMTLHALLLPSFLTMLGAKGTAVAQPVGSLDISLSQAIDLALSQNRSLQIAQLSVHDFEYKKKEAQAAYLPQIKTESSVLHITELAGIAIPAGAFNSGAAAGLIPPRSLFIGQGSTTSYTSGTGLDQPLTQLIKIHNANRAALADVNTAKIQVEEARAELALRVRQLYCGVLIAQLKQEAANEEVRAGEVKAQEGQSAIERGQALEGTDLDNRALVLEARQTLLAERLAVHDQKLELADLLGLPLDVELHLQQDSATADFPIPTRGEARRLALQQSPAVLAAREALEKAKAGARVAADAYIPDVTGLARYSYQSGVPFLVHNFGTFGANVSYVLFDGGRREAERHDSQLLVTEASTNLARVEEDVTVQVEAAFDKVEQAKQMVEVAGQIVAARVESARVADRQFDLEAALASVRAEAHAKSLAAQADLLSARLELCLAQGDIERLLGQTTR